MPGRTLMVLSTEFDRRDQLSDKLLHLANVCLQQGDEEGFKTHYGKGLSLFLTNLQALELEYPGFVRELAKDPDVSVFFQKITSLIK